MNNEAMTVQPITKLIEFLEGQFGTKFKAYYDGDPDEIPKMNLPCIIVVKNNDEMIDGPTQFQRVTEELMIKVVYNKEDDWQSDVQTTQLTEKKIRDIVEARSAAGGYDPTTIRWAIMNRFELENVAIKRSMRFELGTLPRSADLITEEGHLTLTLSYLMPNSNALTN